jgi:hypothetical protein
MKFTLKYFLVFITFIAAFFSLQAKPILERNQYLIGCLTNNGTGTVSPHGVGTFQLIFNPEKGADTAEDTDFWVITNVSDDFYTFRNAVSGQYIAHDITASNNRAALKLVNDLQSDNSTYFRLEHRETSGISYYIVRSVIAPALIWNRRNAIHESVYPLGVYNGSGSTNELFVFYDTEGEPVEDDGKVVLPPATGSRTIGSFAPYLNSFKINGKTPVPDTAKKEFYVSLPDDAMPANQVSCVISYTPILPGYKLYIDGVEVNSGQSMQLTSVGANQSFLLEIKSGAITVVASARLYFTCMPIVQIYTDVAIQNVYGAPARFAVNEVEKEGEPETMTIRIRNRGGISIGFPKKSFAVKLRNNENTEKINRSFFGFRSDNSWILDAMYVDPSRARNRMSTDLWNDFATLPYWSGRESDMMNGTRGRYVEVFLDDAYHGLYCMTEKIDRKQLKLNRLIEGYDMNNNTVVYTQRGLLYKAKSWTTATMYGYPFQGNNFLSNYNNNSGSWSAYEVKYPDLAEGEPITWEPLHRAMRISSSYYTNDFAFRDVAASTFDLPVYLDYYLFLELMLATDNHGKNAYAAVYDLSSSSKITITPWDLDGTWGRRWDGSNSITQATRDFDQFIMQHEHGHMNLYLRLQSLDVDNWSYRLRKRYEELRANHFSHSQLVERYETYFDLFKRSRAAQRESDRWRSLNFDSELSYISTWVETRLNFLDYKYLGGPYTSLASVSYELVTAPNPVTDRLLVIGLPAGIPIQLYNLQGVLLQQVAADHEVTAINMSAYPAGIYIVRSGEHTSRIMKR